MMVDIIEDVNPRYLRNPIAKENMNKDLNEFENEVKGVFPRAWDTLAEFLPQKKVCDRDVMLCPCCSAVFDRFTAKAFESSKIRINISAPQGSLIQDKGKQPIHMLVKEVRKPVIHFQRKTTYLPNARVPSNKWIRQSNTPNQPKWQTFGPNTTRSFVQ